jgi:5-formyltetrahydrofolate cyclo-ligase
LISNLRKEKAELRNHFSQLRTDYEPGALAVLNDRTVERLWKLIESREVKVLHTFLPMKNELNILPLIRKCLAGNIKVVVPKTLRQKQLKHLILSDFDLVTGIFGTQHPRIENEYTGTYDMILVPGLAFDMSGNRLGYGAGYYDRFLAGTGEALKVGIGFPFQLVNSLPHDQHDVQLDIIVTADKTHVVAQYTSK